MKILGIISEYNPFHNGHKYHIDKSKELTGAEAVVAVMSGSFVQRGEPAFADKWLRAQTAVMSGADLVIENPFVYACNSAQVFADGAVNILDGLGCIDFLSFGSEAGSVDALVKFASETDEFKDRLHSALEQGMTYPKAVSFAYGDDDGVMTGPNNILGIEYIKVLNRIKSGIEPVTVKRSDRGYHSYETEGIFASALKIRSIAAKGEDFSEFVPYSYKGYIGGLDYFSVMSHIISLSAEELDRLPSAGEGLGNRIKSQIRKSGSLNSLIDNIRGSRYTRSRISRVLCQMLAGCGSMPENKYYARILGFNSKGAEVLKYIKKSECASIPVITNINREDTSEIDSVLKYDIASSDIYNLLTGRNMYEYSDYVKKPFIMT